MSKKTEVIVTGSCQHIPYHDAPLLKLWLSFIADLKPKTVALLGDLSDLYWLSRFAQDPEHRTDTKGEIDRTKRFVSLIRQVHRKPRELVLLEGNHEERFRKFLVSKAAALARLEGNSIAEQLKLDDFGVKFYPARTAYYRDGLRLAHGHLIRKQAGRTAWAVGDTVGRSVLIGHTHRQGYVPHTRESGTWHGWEAGHMTNPLVTDYLKGPPNWQSGWAVATFCNGGFDVQLARVVGAIGERRKVFYCGQMIGELPPLADKVDELWLA